MVEVENGLNKLSEWLFTTLKDNTAKIGFLKNESQAVVNFVSKGSSQSLISLGKYLFPKFSFT